VQEATRLAQRRCDRALDSDSLRALPQEAREVSAVSRGAILSCEVGSATVLMVNVTATSSDCGKSPHGRDVDGWVKGDAEYRRLHDEGNKTNPSDSGI
jgi:hypothetical protein